MTALAHLRHTASIFVAAALVLAGCSGAVSPGTNVTDPATITVLPASSSLSPVITYSGLPTTLVISGGTGSYLVASNNQAAIPVAGNIDGKSLTLVPNPVLADTTVTLTIRDTGTTPVATVVVLVKPGTVNNNITVTPNANQSASCNPSLCTGTDAQVSVTISQGGIPLAARSVDFSVVSGDFRFITTPPGTTPERLELTARVATDQVGQATIRIRVTPLAPNQTALLQVTDVLSGAWRRTAFGIAQFTGTTPAFFAMPSSLTFTGPDNTQCATRGSANVAVFGGSPPYTVQNSSSAFFLQASGSLPSTSGAVTVFQSGGVFNVSIAGVLCVTDAPITITDLTGRTISVTASSVLGTTTPIPAALQVVPASINLACAGSASFVATGGSGKYFASSPDSRLTVTVAGSTITVKRENTGTGTEPATPVNFTIVVTDGTTNISVTAIAPRTCP